MASLVLFIFGFCGFLATWAGYSDHPNTAFFGILKAGGTSYPIWITVIVSVFAVTMNESGAYLFFTFFLEFIIN